MKSTLILLTLSLSSICYSQNEQIDFYEYFDLYSDWGFSAAALSYRKPQFERNDITEIVADKNNGVQLGARYSYKKNKEWSFNTGFLLNYMHPSKMYFTLDNGILTNNSRDFQGELKSRFYVQLPISAEIKKRMGYNIYFNFNMGLTFSYINGPDYNIIFSAENPNTTETSEIFAMNYSDGSLIYVSALFETGIYCMFKGFMLKINAVYNKAFENAWQGDYKFKNLNTNNEPTEREFNSSGDYFGISTTIYLKRKF